MLTLTDWEYIKHLLPEGWEAKCSELGALTRAREIKTPEDLLTLNLLHVTQGESFQMTSALMKLKKDISVNKNAVYKRIKGSWQWLRWIAQHICKNCDYIVEKPQWLGDKNLLLLDASDVSLKGSKASDYRLHYSFDLFNFSCRSMEITSIKEGEKLQRQEILPNDIWVGDRAYGTISSAEHAKTNGGDFVLRLKSKGFILYDEHGTAIDLLPLIRHLKEWETFDINCYYKSNSELKPVRICAMKKDAKACEQAKRKLHKNASKKQRPIANSETFKFNEYIILMTSLDLTNEQIFELYRARWQVEMVFHRLKSLFGFGEVPSHNDDAVKAWFYGKLLLATLCEAMLKESHFSPIEV